MNQPTILSRVALVNPIINVRCDDDDDDDELEKQHN